MAFPAVGGSALTSRFSNAITDTVNLPAGVAAGDLVIVFHFSDAGTNPRSWPSPWVRINDYAGGGVNPTTLGIGYLIASGGETTVAVTKNVTERFTAIAVKITAGTWHGTTPPEVSTGATGAASANPDPDAITASWGSDDNLFVAIEAFKTNTNGPNTAWPTNYTANQIASDISGTSAGYGAIATRDLTAASDDPGTFTLTGSAQWWAGTMVVRPVPTAAAPTLADRPVRQQLRPPGLAARIARFFRGPAAAPSAPVPATARATRRPVPTRISHGQFFAAPAARVVAAPQPIRSPRRVAPPLARRGDRWEPGEYVRSTPVTLTNNAEGGTNGVTVTTGNSGGASGTAWDLVNIDPGTTFTFANTYPRNTLAYQITPIAGAMTWGAWSTSLGTQSVIYGRTYYYCDTQPDSDTSFFRALGGGALRGELRISTTGQVTLRDSNSTPVVTLNAAFQPGHWNRIEWKMDFAGRTAELRVNNNSPESAVPDQSGTAVAVNYGAMTCDRVRCGQGSSSQTNTVPFRMDDMGVSTVTWLGPTGVPYPPQTITSRRPVPPRIARSHTAPPPPAAATPPATATYVPLRVGARRLYLRPPHPGEFSPTPAATRTPPPFRTRTPLRAAAPRRGRFWPTPTPAPAPTAARLRARAQPALLVRRGRHFPIPPPPPVPAPTPAPPVLLTSRRQPPPLVRRGRHLTVPTRPTPTLPAPRTSRRQPPPLVRRGRHLPIPTRPPAPAPPALRASRRQPAPLVRRGRYCTFAPTALPISTAVPVPTFIRTTFRGQSPYRRRTRFNTPFVAATQQPPITTHTPVFVRMGL